MRAAFYNCWFPKKLQNLGINNLQRLQQIVSLRLLLELIILITSRFLFVLIDRLGLLTFFEDVREVGEAGGARARGSGELGVEIVLVLLLLIRLLGAQRGHLRVAFWTKHFTDGRPRSLT